MKDDPTHGTLPLCVETTKSATTAATTTTITTTTRSNSEVEQVCAERADTAFGNDMAPLGECNALRVGRLAGVGDAWQRRARTSERPTTARADWTASLTVTARAPSPATTKSASDARPPGPVEEMEEAALSLFSNGRKDNNSRWPFADLQELVVLSVGE